MELLELVGRAALFKEASNYARQMHAVNLSQGLPEPLFDDEMYSVLVTQLVEGWQYADPRGEGCFVNELHGAFYRKAVLIQVYWSRRDARKHYFLR